MNAVLQPRAIVIDLTLTAANPSHIVVLNDPLAAYSGTAGITFSDQVVA